MRKNILSRILLLAGITATMFTSCVDDSYLAQEPPVPDQSFVEEFDTLSAAYARGWRTINRSNPIGITDWSNPDPFTLPFTAFSSKSTAMGFAWADFQSTSGTSDLINNWLVSKPVVMQNGDKITFYTRAQLYDDGSGDSTDFANRMQVWLNTNGTDLIVGSGEQTGQFNILLLDINQQEKPFQLSTYTNGTARDAYPHRWTKFEVTVYGLNKPTTGRFAFRYYLHNAGSNGNGSAIGIDKVTYTGKK